MVRSLYAGISGLRNHQVAMDVAGNNIANVNTTGFKTGRVTFKESMAQLLRGASRPVGNARGTNPLQIGLGMSVGSIDMMLTQGNLQSTGKITDLALEGQAFFVYNSGDGNYYSRNGALQLDSTGRLVSPTNGFTLQGWTAATDGTYPASTRIGDIRIPYGEKAPARATTLLQYGCNLDSDSEGLGTILYTNRYLTQAAGTDTLRALSDANGNDLGVQPGDVLTISASGATDVRLTVTETTTLADLQAAFQQVVGQVNPFATVAVQNGQLVVNNNNNGNPVTNLQIQSTRPGSNSYVGNTFAFPATISGADVVQSMVVLRPVVGTDTLASAYDAQGRSLGLQDGDVITVNGAVGGRTIPANAGLTYAATTTFNDLTQYIQTSFGLPLTDGTPAQNPSVAIDVTNSDDNQIPDGSIVLRGQRELAFALTNVTMTATNSDLGPVTPSRFIANSTMTERQAARDTGQHSTSMVVYDESGDAHTLTTTFTHTGRPNEWLWEITTQGGEQILGGNRGRITFGQDGTPASFTYDDNSTQFRFDPMNGSNEVVISLDPGAPGSLSGITQFRAPSTTVAKFQDGYPMGKLEEISIDEYGEITGMYTNGVSKSIARIAVAEFNNPAGLMKRGDTMFSTSNNSGDGIILRPGVGSATRIKPGALEMSNVELASEFTTMITTQRGFQANARVITTSDTMLQELVQLVR